MSDANDPEWLRVDLDCPEPLLEAVTDVLGVLSGSGVEEKPVQEGTSRLSVFFKLRAPDNRQEILSLLQKELAALFAIYDKPVPDLASSLLADEDWATSWQKYFKPFSIIPGLVIKPGWETYQPAQDEHVIEMDPGMAFGTGKHASTHLALQLIHYCLQGAADKKMLDVGTGTGILAMAAVLFGAGSVVALDNDPEAVRVCRENITQNNLLAAIDCRATDISEIAEPFDLICANIVFNVLAAMLPEFSRLLVSGGQLVLAGILQEKQEEKILSLAAEKGFSAKTILHEGEWSGILLIKG
ncbi:MAG: 50S ribosomal protein L11 methyltransferase [Desulfobulbus sp.]|nr:MAG: 50S ribosomal protein L11 methyltransferase [Desulfobulbus sp.]